MPLAVMTSSLLAELALAPLVAVQVMTLLIPPQERLQLLMLEQATILFTEPRGMTRLQQVTVMTTLMAGLVMTQSTVGLVTIT